MIETITKGYHSLLDYVAGVENQRALATYHLTEALKLLDEESLDKQAIYGAVLSARTILENEPR